MTVDELELYKAELEMKREWYRGQFLHDIAADYEYEIDRVSARIEALVEAGQTEERK